MGERGRVKHDNEERRDETWRDREGLSIHGLRDVRRDVGYRGYC